MFENAKEEFLRVIGKSGIECAEIFYEDYIKFFEDFGNGRVPKLETRVYQLKQGYSQKELDEFLETLNFEYNSGYGTQEISGTVWMEDGTWFEREEEDGAEWWMKRVRPYIPNNLKIN